MTSILTDQLRSPPDVIEQHRQQVIVDELFVYFEHLDRLGKQVTAVEARRDRIAARLSDASLLEIHPEDSDAYRTAKEKRDELALLAGQLRNECKVAAGWINLKLKRIHGDRFHAVCQQIGAAYKNEPLWDVVRSLPVVIKSGEWQDLLAHHMRADDGRPPF